MMRSSFIAITGGIGSGKSFVASQLAQRGIAVYDCDAAAKRLMRDDAKLQAALKRLVGGDAYSAEGLLQKEKVRQFILASEENKQKVNSVVHPAVAEDFLKSGKQWLESAIVFDSGFFRLVPFGSVICVTAPLDLRLQRIVRRNGITREKAMEWIERQMPQTEMEQRSDFIIRNDGSPLEPQLDTLLDKLSVMTLYNDAFGNNRNNSNKQ